MPRPELSLVIPIYNEEAVLPQLDVRVKQLLERLAIDTEVVFVNDGSKDRSLEILRRMAGAEPRYKVLGFSRNFGHQRAITAGMDASRGRAVVVMDADLQDPPEVILEMVARWRQGFDVVYGRRRSRRGESLFKLATAKIFYRLFAAMIPIEVPLDTGDFRLMSRRVVTTMRGLRETHRFVRGLVAWVGFTQTAVEYDRAARAAGETKYPLRKMLAFALDGIASFSIQPLRLATYVGVLVGFASVVYGVVAIVSHLIGFTVPGWTTTVVLVSFLFSVQFFMIGVLGEYVGRIYEQVKKRPLYIVADRINFGRARRAAAEKLVTGDLEVLAPHEAPIAAHAAPLPTSPPPRVATKSAPPRPSLDRDSRSLRAGAAASLVDATPRTSLADHDVGSRASRPPPARRPSMAEIPPPTAPKPAPLDLSPSVANIHVGLPARTTPPPPTTTEDAPGSRGPLSAAPVAAGFGPLARAGAPKRDPEAEIRTPLATPAISNEARFPSNRPPIVAPRASISPEGSQPPPPVATSTTSPPPVVSASASKIPAAKPATSPSAPPPNVAPKAISPSAPPPNVAPSASKVPIPRPRDPEEEQPRSASKLPIPRPRGPEDDRRSPSVEPPAVSAIATPPLGSAPPPAVAPKGRSGPPPFPADATPAGLGTLPPMPVVPATEAPRAESAPPPAVLPKAGSVRPKAGTSAPPKADDAGTTSLERASTVRPPGASSVTRMYASPVTTGDGAGTKTKSAPPRPTRGSGKMKAAEERSPNSDERVPETTKSAIDESILPRPRAEAEQPGDDRKS